MIFGSLSISGKLERSDDLPSKYTSVWVKDSSNIHISECSFDNHRVSSSLLENVYLDVTVENSTFTGNESLLDDTELRNGGIVIRLYRDTIILI